MVKKRVVKKAMKKASQKIGLRSGKVILKSNSISALKCPGVDGGCNGYGKREPGSKYCEKCLRLV